MRRLLFIGSAIIALAFGIPVGATSGHSDGRQVDRANDVRKLVTFPSALRTHFLGNMRGHLASLAQIEEALAKGDFDKVADLAEQQLGMTSMARHGAGALAKYMPVGMRRIGSGMHHAASRLAVTAQDASVTSDTQAVLGALTDVTTRCVACHSAYRVAR
jgi:hypothetical protein